MTATNTGEWVKVPNDLGIHPSDAKAYAGVVINKNFDIIDTMFAAIDRNIEDMKEVIKAYDPVEVDVDVDIDKATGPAFPIKPVWGELELDYTMSTDRPTAPNMRPYPIGGFDYLAPVAPIEINPTWDWAADEYTSDMWLALFTEIYNDLVNGGTGLTDSVHSAIVAREQETRRRNQQREQDQAIRSAGVNGFNLKAGEIAAVLSELGAERMQRDQDALNLITVQDFELAQKNDHFIKQLALDFEKVNIDVWKTVQGFGFEAEKAANEFIISVYNANIAKYLAAWKGVEIDVDVWKKEVDAITAENVGKIEIYSKQWDALETEAKTIIAINSGLLQERQGEIDAYRAEIQAVSDQWKISLEEKRVELAGIQLDVGTELEVNKINLGSYNSKNQLAAGIYTDITKLNNQAMASAIGAIHSSNNVSYSGSEGKSESLGHAAGLTEGRTYQTNVTPAP
jgi:hypothetical protein